jgi:hypothetical protein
VTVQGGIRSITQRSDGAHDWRVDVLTPPARSMLTSTVDLDPAMLLL